MTKPYRVLTIIVVVLLALTTLHFGIKYLGESIHQKVIAHKKMYCYETYHEGYVNPAMFVRDESLCDSLKQFYQKLEKGILRPYFNFQPFLVPLDTCVYVLGYGKDSSMAKIAFFYQYKGRHLSATGYVYAHTLHEKRMYNVKK
ncbi:hypothetical protein SAMN05216490_1514 [Mucilaginibacter mallensis]|uniref:Uncharacterized protein n=1 Tax=Mucilaginibacter mallensis TaxID=652787 RepID=A0A1H1TT11_MUCMA|nr:hypothetical protein [Mucilaginibacter mallensis]SDS63465.1 hypothetical protein SAMN05216490_1514 [Mucilaginibacter mallensis]